MCIKCPDCVRRISAKKTAKPVHTNVIEPWQLVKAEHSESAQLALIGLHAIFQALYLAGFHVQLESFLEAVEGYLVINLLVPNGGA